MFKGNRKLMYKAKKENMYHHATKNRLIRRTGEMHV